MKRQYASAVTLTPLADMIERIEAVRLEDAPPVCTACGCSAGIGQLKHCPRCKRTMSVLRFHRNKSRRDGRCAWCEDCAAAHDKEYRSRIAKAALRRVAS